MNKIAANILIEYKKRIDFSNEIERVLRELYDFSPAKIPWGESKKWYAKRNLLHQSIADELGVLRSVEFVQKVKEVLRNNNVKEVVAYGTLYYKGLRRKFD